jgi:molybdenum cofactor guanylyltransferase
MMSSPVWLPGYPCSSSVRHENIRKIDRWTARYTLATVAGPAEPLDSLFRANTIDDFAAGEAVGSVGRG